MLDIFTPSCLVENLIHTFRNISVFSLNLSSGLSGLLKLSSNCYTSTSMNRLSMTKVMMITKSKKKMTVILLSKKSKGKLSKFLLYFAHVIPGIQPLISLG